MGWLPGIDTGGGGLSSSSSATSGKIGGSTFGGVNIGSGEPSINTVIIAGLALLAVVILARAK